MFDGDARAAAALDGERHVAGAVLTEVIDRPALRVLKAADDGQRGKLFNPSRFIGNEGGVVEIGDRTPMRSVQGFFPRVVDLAEIDAVPEDGREAALPAFVCRQQQRPIDRPHLGQCPGG